MIPRQIAMFLAPWCFVFAVAIGCSKSGDSSSRSKPNSGGRDSNLSAIQTPSEATTVSAAEELGSLERYEAILQSHSDPAEASRELRPFYKQWGKEDGEAAVTHAMAKHREILHEAFAGWLDTDPQVSREWVLSQDKSERHQASLASGLLHALPTTDHQARSEWVSHFAERNAGARLVSEVAIGWGRDRPQDALDWLAHLPEGEARTSGIETIFRRWTEADPEVASTHLTKMSDGGAKDLAISSLAKAIHRDDPEAARLWANTITDTTLRERTNGLLNRLIGGERSVITPGL